MERLLTSPANRVFYYFQEISKIPHGSGNTKAISDYCVAFARSQGLTYYQDDLNDVIIIREASPGYETHKPYIIQGHLDMVCEKNDDVDFDFTSDPLDLYIEDGFLRARGTTLGGDDGIAIAYSLALLEMADLKAPRLEVVFTVDEETGMYGAEAIDLSPLKGRDLLNLDTSQEGEILCGCAGGVSSAIEFPLEFKNVHGHHYMLKIHDLEGGHSGDKIHEGHGNPTLLIGRILQDLDRRFDIAIADVSGGKRGNVIPRESSVTFIGDEGQHLQIVEALKEWEAIMRAEFAVPDPELKFTLTVGDAGIYQSVTRTVQNQMISVLTLLPNDVITMSKEFSGHVESSSNVGICYMDHNKFHISAFIRSNVFSKKRMIADRVKALADTIGAQYIESGEYPAWEYRKESQLRDTVVSIYEELFGQAPKLDIIHAGLECGILQGKLPDLDCVSLGPNIPGIHTPRERMDIASVERVWNFLLKLMEVGNLPK